MLEEYLIQYGALGLWTIFNIALIWYLLKRDTARDEKLNLIVNNNTAALAEVKGVLEKCKKNQ